MMTDKQKYYHLMGEVCEILPTMASTYAVRAGYETPANLLELVRIGRRPVLRDLVALVKHALPEFEIPAHLLPEAVAA
ncbi:hypothetical protein CDA63_11905 [Hymenobacter amundsenii]|uniref:Uncharacterized protein n=1 Tax=Hymenobacter amundsenii TaxID=2006685 RepID=A0A246FK11_9BACT|nr:hypothetical protein [Hymenobacter amundsenii]OWP62916.1 hypothetical protein CDA63_11905 [Hymenobacter amundsenii]